MNLRQSISMRPELRLTALQLLTTRLLAEPIAKLEEEIEDALADNEFLVRLDRALPAADRRDAETIRAESDRASDADLWFPDEPTLVATERHDPIVFENHATGVVTLAEHLLDQLRHTVAVGALRVAAEAIIWNVDDNGYLRSELTDIANAIGMPLEATQRALELVQSFDPPGVAARDLRECLLLQLRGDPEAAIARAIVADHCVALAQRRYEYLARVLQIPVPSVVDAMNRIRRLDPKPGVAFGASEVRAVKPEIRIDRVDGRYVVTLTDGGPPPLAVVRTSRRPGPPLSMLERRALSERRQSARWFVEALERRRLTLLRVVETVVHFQRAFFEGSPGPLRPLVLREVADAIDLHESTVSRAISSKYADTPHGVFPLKHFFPPGLAGANGELTATATVKSQLRALIAAEDARQPLSDAELASALEQRGYRIARRTVAKYRDELAIAPRHRRKRWHERTTWGRSA